MTSTHRPNGDEKTPATPAATFFLTARNVSKDAPGPGLGWRSAWPYGLAVAVTVGTLLVRAALTTWAGDRPLLIMFVAPILLSAYAGGLGPGLLATVVAALGTDYFVLKPTGSVFSFAEPADVAPWIILIVIGVMVSILNEALLRSQRRSDLAVHRLTLSEASVRANRIRTQLIVDGALDAVVTIDREGAVIGWNPQAEETFGWTRAEATGQQLAELIIPQQHREAHRQGLERYVATGQAVVLNRRIELTALRRDGQEFPIELAITPIGSGESLAFCAFVRDITARKRAEQALRESEQHYQTLSDSLPHLVWTCRPDGWCDFLSRQWVEYTGRSVEEQVGYGWAESLHPDDRERVQSAWREATVRGDRFDVEFRIRRADGQHRWFRTCAVPLRDSAGVIVKWFGSNTDMEDYKQSEMKLRTQLERLRLLDAITRAIGERQDVESIYQVTIRTLEDQLPVDFCCICLYEQHAHILKVVGVGLKSTPTATELAMLENAAIPIDANGLSRCVRGALVYEPDIANVPFPFPQRLAAGELRSLVVAPLQIESQVFGVLVVARRKPFSFSSGECEFLKQLSEHVGLASHQSQLYRALQDAYDDLRESQQTVMQQERLRALGQMASGIAHDINNGITPVSMCADLLLNTEPTLTGRARSYIETIKRAGEDIAHTVARMGELYRLREQQAMLVPTNLNQVAAQVVELTRARWSDMPQKRGVVIQLATDFQPDLPPIMGLESELREALVNLIFNAVDAMPEGGVLTLRTSVVHSPAAMPGQAPARTVQLEVADSGVGMDEETRRRCFEPFFTTKGDRGTGLGMGMVYGIVKRHDAEIEIASELGKGTTVRLVFPAPVAPTAGSGVEAAPAAVVRLHILIIDDDPLLTKLLRDLLEADGHLVGTANGGQAGIDMFHKAVHREELFDLVFTDLGMPYIDGRVVAKAVKLASPQTPVVLLTGWGHRLVAEDDVPPCVDYILAKPPKLHELRRVLSRVASVRRQ